MKKSSKNGGSPRRQKKADSAVKKDEGLTPKESLFVSAYLGAARFNATQAARMAGYKGDDNVLGVDGYRLLRNPKVSAIVQERINEAAMSANEVLSRLSDIARGKIADVTDDEGRFDFNLAKQRGKDQLLKKVKSKRTSKTVDSINPDSDERETLETALVYEEVEFEMYSAHEALRDLGKYHKLFTDKVEHAGANGQPIILQVVYDK